VLLDAFDGPVTPLHVASGADRQSISIR